MATSSSSSIFKTGNTAVITGGASGIGRALTKKCAAAGMKVLVVDFNPATLKTLGDDKELGGSVATVEADVSKIADWDRVRAVVEDKFGGMVQSPFPYFPYFMRVPSVNGLVGDTSILWNRDHGRLLNRLRGRPNQPPRPQRRPLAKELLRRRRPRGVPHHARDEPIWRH